MEVGNDILQHFNDLCGKYSNRGRAFLRQPINSHLDMKRNLRIKLFNALFGNIEGPHKCLSNKYGFPNVSDPRAIIDSRIYDLCVQEQFDDANTLSDLADVYFDGRNMVIKRSVMIFLLQLTDTSKDTTEHMIGQHVFTMNSVAKEHKRSSFVSTGPISYRDAKLSRSRDDSFFMQFPTNVFNTKCEKPYIESKGMLLHSEIFRQPPGTGIPSLFQSGKGKSTYEVETMSSLFGALLHRKVDSISVKLDTPELPVYVNDSGFQISKKHSVSDCDEGYASTMSSSCLNTPSEHSQMESGWEDATSQDLWDKALAVKKRKYLVWEAVGKSNCIRENPYLSESSKQTFDKCCEVQIEMLTLVDPVLKLQSIHQINMKQLVEDALHLLIGVPSATFIYDKEYHQFRVNKSVHISGISQDSVIGICKPFMQCGSHYDRLKTFSQPQNVQSVHCKGLVFQAFADGINQYLKFFQCCVLSIKKDKTLLELHFILRIVMTQITFLAELCGCALTDRVIPGPLQKGPFPTGPRLLSYLYEECLDACECQHYPILLSLLHCAARPYLMFIQDWVFCGIHRDKYSEFMILVNDIDLDRQDEGYWTSGFCLSDEANNDNIPHFLRSSTNDIFVCGKSINLLKLIAPQHFIFHVNEELPGIRITFSEDDLLSLETRCVMYKSRMQEICRHHSVTRERMLAHAAKVKHDLVIGARHTAVLKMEEIQEKEYAIKVAADQKKRALFSELKVQMDKDLRRRAVEREEELETDKSMAQSRAKQELVATKVDQLLEKQAKEELIKYYSKLSDEAVLREQRALWHVQRKQLSVLRQEFWDMESESRADILKQSQKEQDNFYSTDTGKLNDQKLATNDMKSSPSTNLHNTRENTSEVLDGKECTSHISTSEKGSSVFAHNLVNEANHEPFDSSNSVLSNWAQNTGETIVVDDMETNNKTHSSESSIQDDVYPNKADTKDKKYIRFAVDKKHPSQTSVDGLLKLDSETVRESIRSKFATVDDLKAAQVLHRKHANEASSGKRFYNSTSVIQELLYNKETSRSISTKLSSDLTVEQTQLELKEKCKVTRPSISAKRETEVKFSKYVHSTDESSKDLGFKSAVKMYRTNEMNKELEDFENRQCTKVDEGIHVSSQTVEKFVKPSIKVIECHGATLQSKSELSERRLLRNVEGKHASVQSVEDQGFPKPHLKINPQFHVNKHSEEKLPVFNKPSLFGHVSQLSSMEYKIVVQRLKKRSSIAVSRESDLYTYQIKPKRKKVAAHSIEDQSCDNQIFKPSIKIDKSTHVSQESDHADTDEKRLEIFKKHNIYGHASDSSAQNLLYGKQYGTGKGHVIEDVASIDIKKTTLENGISFVHDAEVIAYDDNFDYLYTKPKAHDLMGNFIHNTGQTLLLPSELSEDTSAQLYASLPTLLNRSISAPLVAQISLVNQIVLNYFNTELCIDKHFEALHHFLLMQDGEFGQSLSDQLFEKLSTGPKVPEIFNPVYLNSILQTALRKSLQSDNPYAGNLSFVMKKVPSILAHNSPDTLKGLELMYNVNWPVNIVITDACLNVYGHVFNFMLLLKRTVWTLKDIWSHLKRDDVVARAACGPQYRQLQIYRHEMQHFVKVMQGYIANQVVQVAWQEFQQELASNVHSLDDLRMKHASYLVSCQARCLLNRKAHKIMQVMENIFSLILKFHLQLVTGRWQYCEAEMQHSHFENMCNTFKSFTEYSRFLYKVVKTLAMRGYQPHLQELVLRMNYNGHYQKDKDIHM